MVNSHRVGGSEQRRSTCRETIVKSLLEAIDFLDLAQRGGGDPVSGFPDIPPEMNLRPAQPFFGFLLVPQGRLLRFGQVMDLLLQARDLSPARRPCHHIRSYPRPRLAARPSRGAPHRAAPRPPQLVGALPRIPRIQSLPSSCCPRSLAAGPRSNRRGRRAPWPRVPVWISHRHPPRTSRSYPPCVVVV